jgi:hypothetical protein
MPEITNKTNIDLQIMIFLYNALNEGWSIKKTNGCYIFSKKHENKKEFFSDTYLKNFVKTNITLQHN